MTLDLPAIRARAEAATPGPWYVEEGDLFWQLFAANGDLHPWQLAKCVKRSREVAAYWPEAADSEFIAHAREDVPALLAEVERQSRNLEAASAECCDLSAYRQLVREEHPEELERVARWVATELRPDLSPAEIDALVAEALEAPRG